METPMIHYVTGFLFDTYFDTVALIKKTKPEWQKGRLNGVGGKIEPGETPLDAMRREFFEETGMTVIDWNEYVVLTGNDYKVHFFYANGNPGEVMTTTEEVVADYEVSSLGDYVTIPNLAWLIPMATMMRYDSAETFLIQEVPRLQ
jgi:8-oxo-dGTP diphosphatase